MTQIKICGLTRPEDVDLACDLGADYVGFNFSSLSRRRVSLEAGSELAAVTRPGTARVGVFVDDSFTAIEEAVDAARLDLVQIHRPLREIDLERISRPVIAVARVSASGAELPPDPLLSRCRSLLFDTARGERGGGHGARFDWALLDGRSFPIPFFLAGGLTPVNVAAAIERVRPAAVDVASGVEQSPGIKDPRRMRRFFDAVREADARGA